LLLVLLLLSIS